MKFLTLKSKEVNIDIKPSDYPVKSEENCRSKGQFKIGQFLREIYSINSLLLEDFIIPESKLSLDFYLPHYNLALEIQGEQHLKFNSFFHNNISDYIQQKKRDSQKKNWCLLNRIKLIEIIDTNITIENFRNKLYGK